MHYLSRTPLSTTGEGINAQGFPYLDEADVKEVIGKLSVGGRGIFRKLWREYRIIVRI